MPQVILGYGLLLLYIFVMARPIWEKWDIVRRFAPRMNDRERNRLALLLVGISFPLASLSFFHRLKSTIFAACDYCPVSIAGRGYGTAEMAIQVPGYLLLHSITIIPFFVVACFLAAVISRFPPKFNPRNMFQAFAAAAILPICACGVIPLVRGMAAESLGSKKIALVFLITAPILSPLVIVLAAGTLGIRYVFLRVVCTFILAIVGAHIVAQWWQPQGEHPARKDPSCCKCPAWVGLPILTNTWNNVTFLFRYLVWGLVVGALAAIFVSGSSLRLFVREDSLALLALGSAGIPINLCAGAEIPLLSPFVEMGLPLGHAVTFTLASTGICATSIPLLIRILKRRATTLLLIVIWSGSILLGFMVNTVSPLLGERPSIL